MEFEIEKIFAAMERAKAVVSEQKVIVKENKDLLIEWMKEKGVDEYVIEGMDGPVQLCITYPEREVLNKKGLAERLGMKQKELSKPQNMVQLTVDGKITPQLMEEFTSVEEREQFSVKELQPELEESDEE